MKVSVTFGDTAVVVPCKEGWTVRDLADQATRRYRRILQQVQQVEYVVRTHHVEYGEGGILDMDDLLSELLEDKDRLVAVFEEIPRGMASSPGSSVSSNGRASPAPSPDPLQYTSHFMPQQPIRAEIEVNEAVLKSNTPLLVRSSSDSALAPPSEVMAPPPHDDLRAPGTDVHYLLKGVLDRVQTDKPTGKMTKVNFSPLTRTVEFSGDKGPLGIHVVPYNSSLSGRSLGLHIKGIEENSRSRRDDIFQEDECIVQINDTPLLDKTFAQSQEVFRQVLGSPLVRLEVLPVSTKTRYEKSLIGQLFTGDAPPGPPPPPPPPPATNSPLVLRTTTTTGAADNPPAVAAKPPRQKPQALLRARTPEPALEPFDPPRAPRPPSAERAAGASPGPPSPPLPPVGPNRSQSPRAAQGPADRAGPAGLAARKGGKRMKIELKKGSEGLGFTVVTRDSALHGPGPILVKNILPRGAAIRDGRLQPGDRILEVNGVDMTERTQEELVGMLRSTKQGDSVYVVVARPDEAFLPRELKGEDSPTGGDVLVQEDGRERLMFEVPLNDTGSAGLGLSLKGNRSRETGEDLGIFIKSIIHGGAAHKDGRLRANDQLLAVNGETLLGRSNHQAMETLRRSMSSEGNARGTIQLVLQRAAQTATSQSGGGSNAGVANDNQDANFHAANQVYEEPGDFQTRGPEGPPVGGPQRQGAQRGPSPYGGGSASEHINANGANASQPSAGSDGYAYGRPANAGYFPPTANGAHGRYDNNYDDDDFDDKEEELTQNFPPPPSPGAMVDINRDLPPAPAQHSNHDNGYYRDELEDRRPDGHQDLHTPRSRASKSMDLVADESNMGSLVGPGKEPRAERGALGPTLGLWKSSSLESLQTAVSEARQKSAQEAVPFHHPRPQVVRGRGYNQSFRIAIDRSYEGPSEDDDDLSEQSSGRDTPASGSSRQDLYDEDDKKKKKMKKTKAKKEKKPKAAKKKADESSEDTEKKAKKKGFGLLRFGKKKEDKNKETSKALKNKLEALSEEELERNAHPRSARPTPEGSLHSVDNDNDDDSDPNYARIGDYRVSPPPPQVQAPPPAAKPSAAPAPYRPPDDLDGLYAKVNKQRAAAAQYQPPSDSEPPRHQGQQRREYQPSARPAPTYEDLDAVRRRGPEPDAQRTAPRGADSRPAPPYDDPDRHHAAHARRKDPYDYPTHTRPRQADAHHHQQHHQQQQQHRPARQDAPPYPPASRGGSHHYESVGEPQGSAYRDAGHGHHGNPDHHHHQRHGNNQRHGRAERPGNRERSASTDRYVEPDRYARDGRHHERSASNERYAGGEPYGYRDEGGRPDPRHKNPLIGAV